MKRLALTVLLALAPGLAQVNVPNPALEKPVIHDLSEEAFYKFFGELHEILLFGPDLAVPFELLSGKDLTVIAGRDDPPAWLDRARRVARVHAYLLPGRIPRGSFMVADDRYLIQREEGVWRVVESVAVALITKAYLSKMLQVLKQGGVY